MYTSDRDYEFRTDCPIPSISAVIVNFNGGDRILNCLDALYRQSVSLTAVMVVDNGSTDDSVRRIGRSFPHVQVVQLGENRGLPAARNVGLIMVGTELVLFIDNDVYLEKDCLFHLLRTHQLYRAAVVCPRILLFPHLQIVQCDGAVVHFTGTMILRHGYQPIERAPIETKIVGGCIGACLLVDRDCVMAAGGFDQSYFFYFEDLEFSIRLRSLGHRLVCEPTAEAYHDRGSGIPGLSFRRGATYPRRRVYLTLRHRLLTIFIHYRIRTLVALLPLLVLYELASLSIALVRGWAAEWARAWRWQFNNATSILHKRKRMQRERLLNDRDLLVGGPIPLAPGFLRSRIEDKIVVGLSRVLNAYWRLAQHWIG